MSSSVVTVFGGSLLTVLLAGYLAQQYLPPPTPKIVGIDLGTTFSCVGVYHAVTGEVDVIKNKDGKKCIPSIVAFSGNDIVVGYPAAAQIENNSANTIYDAKRFIGKLFEKKELQNEALRYAFQLKPDEYGMVQYVVGPEHNKTLISPEEIGARIIQTLKETAERNLSSPVKMAVMSVPAEFDELQRNYTKLAAKIAGIEVLRIINEPTAAALAYGLHKKEGINNVIVVDLGGGTLDVSLLNIQGGMFFTRAMAGNNHLGGQDFTERLFDYVKSKLTPQITTPMDLQTLRLATEDAKLHLTFVQNYVLHLSFEDQKMQIKVTRDEFEKINEDLFLKVLEPIKQVLDDAETTREEVDEIVLVGGSTRIPKVQQIIEEFFGKSLNTAIDPELAVASGVSIQAGILGGMWPLTVSAIELPTKVKKIQIV